MTDPPPPEIVCIDCVQLVKIHNPTGKLVADQYFGIECRCGRKIVAFVRDKWPNKRMTSRDVQETVAEGEIRSLKTAINHRLDFLELMAWALGDGEVFAALERLSLEIMQRAEKWKSK